VAATASIGSGLVQLRSVGFTAAAGAASRGLGEKGRWAISQWDNMGTQVWAD
jgi:hypothetical protein